MLANLPFLFHCAEHKRISYGLTISQSSNPFACSAMKGTGKGDGRSGARIVNEADNSKKEGV